MEAVEGHGPRVRLSGTGVFTRRTIRKSTIPIRHGRDISWSRISKGRGSCYIRDVSRMRREDALGRRADRPGGRVFKAESVVAHVPAPWPSRHHRSLMVPSLVRSWMPGIRRSRRSGSFLLGRLPGTRPGARPVPSEGSVCPKTTCPAPACSGNAATCRGATVIRRSRPPRAAPETAATATPGCRRRRVWARPRCIRRWRGGDGAPRPCPAASGIRNPTRETRHGVRRWTGLRRQPVAPRTGPSGPDERDTARRP